MLFAKWLAVIVTLIAQIAVGAAHATQFPRTVTVAVGTSTGGGYDAYARLVVRHLSRFLPGNPTVTIKYMPGASGMLMTNWLYNIAPKDGSVIGISGNQNAYAPLLGISQAKFDPRQFNWLGSLGSMTDVVAVSSATPYKDVNSLFKDQIKLSTTAGGDGAIVPNLLNQLIGTNFKVVIGYPDSSAAFLAVQRGEVDGTVDMAFESLEATHSDMLRDNKLRILMQVALHKNPRLKDVPFALDYTKSTKDREVLELLLAKLEYGRPFMAPPGIDADVVRTLQTAFYRMSTDPQFLVEAEQQKLYISYRVGDKIHSLIESFYQMPATVVARARTVLKQAGQAGIE